MARTHNPGKRDAQRRYLFHVDVIVPAGGLGERLNHMLEWCLANITAGEWEQQEFDRRVTDYERIRMFERG